MAAWRVSAEPTAARAAAAAPEAGWAVAEAREGVAEKGAWEELAVQAEGLAQASSVAREAAVAEAEAPGTAVAAATAQD